MSYSNDYYSFVVEQKGCSFASKHLDNGLLPNCTIACIKAHSDDKEGAYTCYRDVAFKTSALGLQFPSTISFAPDFNNIPFKNAIGIEVHFKLKTPWYSKDDRPFHVMDNPIHKDWVFGVPYISGSAWKGMLRWAYRMEEGQLQSKDKVKSSDEIVHLFGNEKEEKTNFLQGALHFYPTFFNKVGFEVINPHSRVTKAGTNPIYYEVVPAGEEIYTLYLLYAPARPNTLNDKKGMNLLKCEAMLEKFIAVINTLLTKYGISAKRTVGWGACSIVDWSIKKHKSILSGKTYSKMNDISEVNAGIKEVLNAIYFPKYGENKRLPGYLIV